MSLTRQQRRQQLLNELAAVRHLLLEPSDQAAASARDSIPTLSEVMPAAVLSQSATPVPPVLQVDVARVDASAATAEQAIGVATGEGAVRRDTAAADAMQQLINKLTQRPTSETSVSLEQSAQPAQPAQAAALLFTPAPPTAQAVIEAPTSKPLLFQALTETPVFEPPTFTELQLREPQFACVQTSDTDNAACAAQTAPNSDASITETAENNAVVTADDIEQLLFEVMPAVEELLRERLSRLLLKA